MRKKILGAIVLGGVAIFSLLYFVERSIRKEVTRAEEDDDFDNDFYDELDLELEDDFEECLDSIDGELTEDLDRDLSVDEMVENYQILHCKER